MNAPVLRRMVITFSNEGVPVIRTLYRHHCGANPGTKRRAREVGELVRVGLKRVFDALEDGEIVVVGEAGFEVREDVLSVEERSPSDRRTDVGPMGRARPGR
jgi:hypothetical protein